MKTKPTRGRPPKRQDEIKGESLLVRLDATEKQAFQDAADASGIALSSWVRERLRSVARRELIDAGLPVAFVQAAVNRGTNE